MDPDLAVFLRRPAAELKLQNEFEAEETITCLAVSSDGIVAIGQTDVAAILLLDGSLSLLRELPGHAGGTNAVAFSGGALNRLVSAGEDGTAAITDPTTGDLLARLECEGENVDRSSAGHTVSHAVCNADGTMAACAAGRTLHAFELGGPDYESRRRVFPAVPAGVIEDVKWVGSGRLLCSYYGGVVLHSTEPGGFGVQLEYGTNIFSAAALPDLSYICGGCMDSCTHIWHFTASPEAAAAARTKAKEASAAGGQQAAGDDEDAAGSSELIEFSCGGYEAKVTNLQFNASHTLLATLGGTQSMTWEFTGPRGPAGHLPVVGLGHTKTVTCLAWQPLPASPMLSTGGKDGRVLVYDVSEYAEPPEEEEMPIPRISAPVAVAPQPDLRDEVTALQWGLANPKHLYAAHASGTLRCWQLELEEEDQGGDGGEEES